MGRRSASSAIGDFVCFKPQDLESRGFLQLEAGTACCLGRERSGLLRSFFVFRLPAFLEAGYASEGYNPTTSLEETVDFPCTPRSSLYQIPNAMIHGHCACMEKVRRSSQLRATSNVL